MEIEKSKWPPVNTTKAFRSSGTLSIPSIFQPNNKDSVSSNNSKPAIIKPDRSTSSIFTNENFKNNRFVERKSSYNVREQTLISSNNKNSVVPNEHNNTKKSSVCDTVDPKLNKTYTKLFSNNSIPHNEYNKLKWIMCPKFIFNKLDFKLMEESYGVEYTKNLIYTIMNDDYGSFYFNMKNLSNDALDYLYN